MCLRTAAHQEPGLKLLAIKYGVSLNVSVDGIADVWERAVDETKATFSNLGVSPKLLVPPLCQYCAEGQIEAPRQVATPRAPYRAQCARRRDTEDARRLRTRTHPLTRAGSSRPARAASARRREIAPYRRSTPTRPGARPRATRRSRPCPGAAPSGHRPDRS